MTLGKLIPVLRSFDEVKAKEFYVGYLGFTVDWEPRLADIDPYRLGPDQANPASPDTLWPEAPTRRGPAQAGPHALSSYLLPLHFPLSTSQ